MGQENKHWMTEPDIGSGEKAPSQEALEREQSELRTHSGQGDLRAGSNTEDAQGGETLRSDGHLARVATERQDDGSYEAQVFVRLSREPKIAETYIPVGIFPSEAEARAAAEERAKRALDEEEF